jgi:hypothetical protein
MPAGVTYQFAPAQVYLSGGGVAQTTLTLSGTSSTPGGASPLVITGTLRETGAQRTAAFSLGTQVTTFQVASATGSAIVHNTGQEVQVTHRVPAGNAPRYTTCASANPSVTCRVISAAAGAVTLGITAGTSTAPGNELLSLDDATPVNATIENDVDLGDLLSVSISQPSISAGQWTDVVVSATGPPDYTCVYYNYCDAAVEVVDQSGRQVGWPVYFLQDSDDNGISVTLSPGPFDAGTDSFVVGWCFPYNYAVIEVETACEIGSVPLTVNPPAPVCATLTNFTETFQNAGTDGTLYFNYTWSSSTGNTKDLSSCTVGETVFYPSTNNPYQWPAPMVASTTNPTLISGPATNAGFLDRNMPPTSYSSPYIAASFDAIQRFWWDCPCHLSGDLQNPLGDITISRKVFQDSTDGKWKYQITKSSQTATTILP